MTTQPTTRFPIDQARSMLDELPTRKIEGANTAAAYRGAIQMTGDLLKLAGRDADRAEQILADLAEDLADLKEHGDMREALGRVVETIAQGARVGLQVARAAAPGGGVLEIISRIGKGTA